MCIENICLVSGSDGGVTGDGACTASQRQASPLGRLAASDAGEGDQLGGAIALAGSWMAIGADLDDDRGDDAGAVYLFERDGQSWVERQKLTASDGDMQDGFGAAVALDGDVLVIGAPSAGAPAAGAAYVFTLAGGTWSQQARLIAPGTPEVDDLFGRAVAVRGDRIGVGAPGADAGTGAVHMFRGGGATWNDDGSFLPGDAAESFGAALAMSDDTLAIGAPLDDDTGTASGSVFRLTLDSEDWVSAPKVTASDAGANDQFGSAVALAGARLAVGAPYRNETGAVYVYETGTGGEIIVTRTDEAANDAFGRAVASDGAFLAVGVPGDDQGGTSAGSVSLFASNGGDWVEIGSVRDDTPVDFDTFGASVALAGDQLAVGLPLRDGEPALGEAGAADAYDLVCP